MSVIEIYLKKLFETKEITIPPNRQSLFEEFISTDSCKTLGGAILDIQKEIMKDWQAINEIEEFFDQNINIPNATQHKPYEAKINTGLNEIGNVEFIDITGIDELGLTFNQEEFKIEGSPTHSGDFKFNFLFKIKDKEQATFDHKKEMTVIINPDPKTLWKDIPSNKDADFWKKDDDFFSGPLGNRNIVVSSKRGRSHKNVGSFREDDYNFKYFEQNGWSVVAVADGAGSYSLSRLGSKLACSSVIEYFENEQFFGSDNVFDEQLSEFDKTKDETLLRNIEVSAFKDLYLAAKFTHEQIKKHALETSIKRPELFDNPKAKTPLDYYHSTLIFTLFKKYHFGYVVLSFGVGDCPIALMDKKENSTTLLNWLDVGEFGGGTRFITQPDIFHSKDHPMASRFKFTICTDFSYLFLMTDGIYDPKFVVEANLEKNEKWSEFLADLKGKNEDGIAVDFDKSNSEIALQLSEWMDFWSPGNHDDRTLAIVF